MYAAQREQRREREQVGDLESWLASLEMRVRVEPLGESNLARAAQLLNKTNQLNLSTRRLSAEELRSWAAAPGRRLWTLRLADRLGDHGLIGIASVEREGTDVRIVDFLLSCRVFGRRLEDWMTHAAVRFARAQGAARLVARYVPTAKNAPCLEFLQRSGFVRAANGFTWTWPADRDYPAPRWLSVDWADAPDAGGAQGARS
jgi:FkbH-like protein